MARRLLVGYDGSSAARVALQEATEIAAREHGTLTVVAAVWPGMLDGCAWLAPSVPRPDPEEIACCCLRSAIDRLPAGVSVTWLARAGEPVRVLAEEAEARCCDAIVVGRSRISHLFGGGVARRLRRRTSVPVIVAGAPARSRRRTPAPATPAPAA